jgi:hypothetical protein
MNLSISNSKNWATAFVSLVLLGLGSFFLISEWLISTHVEPNDPFARHVEHYFRSTDRNAVFGDSIAAHGFIGLVDFPNFAYPQESPMQMLVKARGRFANKAPKNIIVEASLTLLYRSDASALHYPHVFLRGAPPLFKVTQDYHRERLPRYWRVFLSGSGFKGVYRYQPFGGVEWRNWTSDRQNGLASYKAAFSTAISQLSSIGQLKIPNNRKNYRDLIEYLQNRGANICIVEWPVHPTFAEATDKLEPYVKSRTFFRDLARNQNIRYHSYWKKIQDQTAFADHTHLTHDAASRFSSRIINDCFTEK